MIFNDAVLNNSNPVASITVGMGVVLLWFAMGGPARMANPTKTWSTLNLHAGRQVIQLSLGTNAMQVRVLQGGDASGVITAIFQLTKTFQQQW